MKADVQYNDLKGTVCADISDFIGEPGKDNLEALARYFKIDKNRFKVVGLSIFGTENFQISLFCVDKDRSTLQKEHIVKISCPVEREREILDTIFKRLNIVLHKKFDTIYPDLKFDEEASYSEFHTVEEEENCSSIA